MTERTITGPLPPSPSQPLPKLEDFLVWLIRQIPPPPPKSFKWDAGKLDEVKKKFKPYAPESGMGCMQACYDVLGILFTPKVAGELRAQVITQAYDKAKEWARKNPTELKRRMDAAKTANPDWSDAKARQHVLDQLSSPHNTSDHLFELMKDKGLAGDKVHVANKDVERSLRTMTDDAPGVYFFGLAVKDHHTVTLAVDRAADGSQKIYWMDQNHPGLRTEIKPGKLENALEGVFEGPNTTNIYAYRPPAP